MITVNTRPNETLPAYLSRCLDTAQRTLQTACASFEGTVVIIKPSMEIQELADAWVEASQCPKCRRRA